MNVIYKFCLVVFVLCLFCLIGCGGGTTGTGDIRNPRIEGQVRTNTGEAFSGVQVFVSQSGDSSVSDSEGKFVIETSFTGTSLDLVLAKENFEGRVGLGEIPAGESVIKTTLEVNEGENLITVVSVEVKEIREGGEEEGEGMESGGGSSSDTSEDEEESASEDDSNTTPKIGFSIFKGSLLFRDGSPVEGARITVIGPNNSDTTNSSGRFSIRVKSKPGDVSILIKYGESSGTVLVRDVPKKDVVVEVTLQINLDPPEPGEGLPGPGVLPVVVGGVGIR